ncbi:transcriptional regulator AfsR [Amycolatopsis oliviviridis]|uniref:Regulatory protein AfsR n=1 Tax=Amycolatopsis oliviviridis TaxID=1471590 RepID=A0ABQ3LPQ2_9PSEU|nr:AfsR/SARP family transcriptional regulator [Amycolatopsis oliviviridis]GHH22414.1 regulatory protein AfsR [Amycolatopsis oliviviridis]
MAAAWPGVRFVVLGPMRLYRPDGVAISVGTPKQQAMLATLALTPGTAVSLARLTDTLWDHELPARAASTVRTYAWRLRRLLSGAGAGDDVLVSAGDGYRLAVPPSAVDASRAAELGALAQEALASGDAPQARQMLSEALALWTGEPLAGVPGLFAEQSRGWLGELHTALTEQYLEAELRLGHYYEALPRLTGMIAEHPMRERLYVLLMRALFGMGRQVEALRVFQDARRGLVEVHGVEPGAELVELHARILRGDDVAPAPRAEPPVTLSSPAEQEEPPENWRPIPAQLPPDLPDFTGRQDQLSALLDVLETADGRAPAMLAITGMSGVGKTSLAVHLAHGLRERYPDGQLHVDLGDLDQVGEPVTGPDLLELLLAGLGVPSNRSPGHLAERRGLWRSLVDGRRLLIVLDNVVDAAQIRDALPGTPGCAVLITSRARLDGLPLLTQVNLDVFTPAEALDLLRQGVGARRLEAEPDDAVDLVTACGLLPLAVRIVASRLAARPHWTLRSMVERLRDERRRIAELRAGPLAIEAVFEVAYRQLAEPLAKDFVLLTAVAGGEFTLPEAAAVLGVAPAEAEARLEVLVDASILDDTVPGRFRVHELLVSFGRGRDRDPGDELAALDRLLSLLMATARNAFARAVPGDPTGDVLGPRSPGDAGLPIADLRAARDWASAAGDTVVAACARVVEIGTVPLLGTAIDLLIAMSPFAAEAGARRLDATAGTLARAAARVPEPAGPGRRARHRVLGRAEFLCSTVALRTATHTDVEAHARRAVAAATEAGDPVILRQALNNLGLAAQLRHDYGLAVRCFDRSAELARRLGHSSGALTSSLNSAHALLRGGDPANVLAVCESALALAREIGDAPGTGYALYVLGLANHALERYEAAAAHFTACVDSCLAAGIRDRAAHALFRLAETLLALGKADEAAAEARAALRLCEELGTRRDQANALLVLGKALATLGNPHEAEARLNQAHTHFVALNLPEADDAARAIEELSNHAR